MNTTQTPREISLKVTGALLDAGTDHTDGTLGDGTEYADRCDSGEEDMVAAIMDALTN